MGSNLYVLPAYGKAITVDDQGVYYLMNRQGSAIHAVIQLAYQGKVWSLHQLRPSEKENEFTWQVMAQDADFALHRMSSYQITHYFNRPEFVEPKGAWQVLHNAKFGFGKFTPLDTNIPISYALIVLKEQGVQSVVKLHQVERDSKQVTIKKSHRKQAEFA